MSESLEDYERRLGELAALYDLILTLRASADNHDVSDFVERLIGHIGARVGAMFTTPEGGDLAGARLVATAGIEPTQTNLQLPPALVTQLHAQPRSLHNAVFPRLEPENRNGLAIALTDGEEVVGALIIAGLGRWPAYVGHQYLLKDIGPRLGGAIKGARHGIKTAALANDINNALGTIIANLHQVAEDIEHVNDPVRRHLEPAVADALDATDRLHEAVRSLQLLARLPARPRTPVPQPVQPEQALSRILVIDDDVQISSSLKRLLRSHDVDSCPSAQQARDRIEAGERFDVLLCDVLMGGMTGIELYDWMSEHHPDQAKRVMFMTGAFSPEIRSFLSRIDNPVLHKPFDAKTLRWMIGQHLSRLKRDESPGVEPPPMDF